MPLFTMQTVILIKGPKTIVIIIIEIRNFLEIHCSWPLRIIDKFMIFLIKYVDWKSEKIIFTEFPSYSSSLCSRWNFKITKSKHAVAKTICVPKHTPTKIVNIAWRPQNLELLIACLIFLFVFFSKCWNHVGSMVSHSLCHKLCLPIFSFPFQLHHFFPHKRVIRRFTKIHVTHGIFIFLLCLHWKIMIMFLKTCIQKDRIFLLNEIGQLLSSV